MNFFPLKVPRFVHVLFNLVKHSLVFFFAGLHFVSEKNEDKISKCAQWMQQSAKIQTLLKEKIHPKKSLKCRPALHQAIQLVNNKSMAWPWYT